MLELLAPAGSMEAVTAAVQNGADAVYFGYGDFNARRGARNFTREEAAAAVSYCHLRGCKVNLTLNTLLTDRELPAAAEVAAHASGIGVDAVIGQDLGVARVVLGRELSRDQIAYICQNAPIEIEVFGHGALCMCWSGQCFFSSVIGGRSGNRGMCAQPCRLNYGWGSKADEHPLSLKDLSLAGHLKALEHMGVACLKLEGRMKRPEYVAIVTGIYARALREDREPTPEEIDTLKQAFSRQGFTDGYYMGEKGPDMFGTRQEEKEPRELYAQARSTYENGVENRKEPVRMYALIQRGQPAQAAAEDREGRVVQVEGPVPEEAKNVPLTREKVEGQLARTGGTPFQCEKATARVEEGLSLPLSALNDLRRRVLEELGRERQKPVQRRREAYQPGVRYENQKEGPVFTVSLRTASQLSTELLKRKPALLYLPAGEGAAHPEAVVRCQKAGVPVAAVLPRICTDGELPQLERELVTLRALGVAEALAGTWGMVRRAQMLGFQVRGDYGLGVYNSQTMKELKRLGLIGATVSFEMKFPQIRDISKTLPTEFIAYGRLPLMITENCIIHNHCGRHTCNNVNLLTDRKGERFPVVKAWGCRNEIYNSKKIFLADKQKDWQKLGLWGARLMFTTENALECAQVLERYMNQGKYQPNDFTRGLYYRDVE